MSLNDKGVSFIKCFFVPLQKRTRIRIEEERRRDKAAKHEKTR
jgi:hypothetical protein